jgi:hypothetical protein
MSTPRAVVGPALVVVGTGHTALTPVLYPGAVRRLLGAGVVGAVHADPEDVAARSLAFWFATTGVSLVVTGLVVTSLEHRAEPLPRSLPWVLLGVGAWGVVQMPVSPFWVFPVLAGVAEVRRRVRCRVTDASP